MPTYEYECQKCGKIIEVLQSMTDPPLKRCKDSKCRGKLNRLVGAGAGLIFKGSGFYITDYKNKASGHDEARKSDGEKKSSEKSSESKSESKSDSKSKSKSESKSESKSSSNDTGSKTTKSASGESKK